MKRPYYILAIGLSISPYLVEAQEPLSGEASAKQKTVDAASLETRDPLQHPRLDLPAAVTCDVVTTRADGKVTEMYWTNTPDNRPITTDTVDHQVNLNLVVKTTGYKKGDCIEATIGSDDGTDITADKKEIILRGRVHDNGIVFFKEPLRGYTLDLNNSEQ